jgi:S-adenosylmethionine decarboxylase
MGKTETYFGVHFMVDGYNAPKEALEDKGALLDMLKTLPGKMSMYAISEPLVVEVGPNNKKDPGGLSGIVLIAESHISFHTFPRRGFVTIDIYTCADELDTDQLLKEIKKVFKFTDEDTHYIKRGVRYPQTDTN